MRIVLSYITTGSGLLTTAPRFLTRLFKCVSNRCGWITSVCDEFSFRIVGNTQYFGDNYDTKLPTDTAVSRKHRSLVWPTSQLFDKQIENRTSCFCLTLSTSRYRVTWTCQWYNKGFGNNMAVQCLVVINLKGLDSWYKCHILFIATFQMIPSLQR